MATSMKFLGSPFLLSASVFLHSNLHTKVSLSPSRRGIMPLAATIINERRMVRELGIEEVKEEAVELLKVRVSVTVKRKAKEELKEAIENHIDALGDKLGRKVMVQLVSNDLNSKTMKAKVSKAAALSGWLENRGSKQMVCIAEFIVDMSFGVPGAVTLVNNHHKEFYLESIVVEGFPAGAVHFTCNSWVQPTKNSTDQRVFFSNMPYLPSDTPPGLRELRERELKELRGDGTGMRKLSDRVYDYAVYNDMGDPDKGIELARPKLGGESLPFPRRCRTGRPPSITDRGAESTVEYPKPIYVPRDETFGEEKVNAIKEGAVKAVLHNLVPSLAASISEKDNKDFKGFNEVESLFMVDRRGLDGRLTGKIPFLRKIQEMAQGLLCYQAPFNITKDKFAWMRDDEFARQTLAGINPVSVERLKDFPPTSKLDPSEYGPPESAITEEDIAGHLEGLTVQQALEGNKLYVLDHHDAYLPFVEAINAEGDGRKSYATRTIFFLTSVSTLKPIAIELALPQPAATKVLTPPEDATGSWLWQLAKAHVTSNDAGVHNFVNHFLRTHAVIEPFILAARRQLSAMHPVLKLLAPHMRYTLHSNAVARQLFVSAGGILETPYTVGRFGMEISSAAYGRHWRFDCQSLPADLLRRGMAVEDPAEEYGLRLMIEDYPYANDGLLIWAALEKWVRAYVEGYYRTPAEVRSDNELQAWYQEAVQVGHEDKAGDPGWPRLETQADVAGVLTTLVWLSSAYHASMHFGQYPLGAYTPSRPTLMRRLLPEEDDEHARFMADPERFFFSSTPAMGQATMLLAAIELVSAHSRDEEYLGERPQPETWTGDPAMVEAFRCFAAELEEAEGEMRRRNGDPRLRNRCGAGVIPYELMMPSSGHGITGRGVPNSVSS